MSKQNWLLKNIKNQEKLESAIKSQSAKKWDYLFDKFLSFQKDRNIVIVVIGYEIEKRLFEIAKNNKIKVKNNDVEILFNSLKANTYLDGEISCFIFEVLKVLKEAYDSDMRKYDNKDLDWAIEKGTLIIKYLNSLS